LSNSSSIGPARSGYGRNSASEDRCRSRQGIAKNFTRAPGQIIGQSTFISYVEFVASNTSGDNPDLIDVTDSDVLIDTLVMDIRGSTSIVSPVRVMEPLSTVRIDRLVVLADAALWGSWRTEQS
jgi:hypothetical protein